MTERRNRETDESAEIEADRDSLGQEKTASGSEGTNENPPRTTSRGWFTVPKFGSATSGGGEIEPGEERD
jgi:hypothetical protein